MSVKIIGTNIIMTRGDTLRVKVDVLTYEENLEEPEKSGYIPYTPVSGDYIRFACKKTWNSDACCIRKEIPIDTLELVLEPEDTKNLAQPSDYVYDVQITMADGTVDTFITGVLSIMQEVD